jgi:hypothetical protein
MFRERTQKKTGPTTMTGLSPTGTLINIPEILQVCGILEYYWYKENFHEILQLHEKTFMKSYRYTEKHL